MSKTIGSMHVAGTSREFAGKLQDARGASPGPLCGMTSHTHGRLAGKVAVITGGNSGIGLATAHAFVTEGARVVIVGRDRGTLDGAAGALRESAVALGGTESDVVAVAADVTRPDELDGVVDVTRHAFGRVDVLFVNAAVGAFRPIADATEEHFDAIFDANVKGAYFTVQKALPLLVRGASVILTGSVNDRIGMAGASVYSASKAAIRSFARTLSADLNGMGVRVNVISPGPVCTPIYDRLGLPAAALEAVKAGIRDQVPLGRFAESSEIAAAVVFLASDESRYFVGSELVVDGGLTQL
jgi:NAD(P)-dependent dehydrogenase (short-subunit alcohol dehydrogenase family)